MALKHGAFYMYKRNRRIGLHCIPNLIDSTITTGLDALTFQKVLIHPTRLLKSPLLSQWSASKPIRLFRARLFNFYTVFILQIGYQQMQNKTNGQSAKSSRMKAKCWAAILSASLPFQHSQTHRHLSTEFIQQTFSQLIAKPSQSYS